MVHLLVTDVVMPRMSGRQLADLLAVELPGLSLTFATIRKVGDAVSAAQAAGARA